MRFALAVSLVLPLVALGQTKATAAACKPLPPVVSPNAFSTGETLDFTLDAMGAEAGSLRMRALPQRSGVLQIRVDAETNTLFSKVRRVKGTGVSLLDPQTLASTRYTEDAVENGVHKWQEVRFEPATHLAHMKYTIGARSGGTRLPYRDAGIDVGGALYLMRQLPLEVGAPVCFDVYGIRRMWRMTGIVESKEHVSLPIGEFEAWHLSGKASRIDNPKVVREVHVWISADSRRLPLAAVGMMDVGAVRATLTGFSQGGQRKKAQGKESLKW